MVGRSRRRESDDDPSAWTETPEGREALETDPERVAWAIVGRNLYLGRKRFQWSKREAARRAGISEALWRQLEGGGEMVKPGLFLPNPRPENLVAAALAVEVDPEKLFKILGRDAPEGIEKYAAGGFTVRFNQLHEHDQFIISQLIDLMLATREYRGDEE